MKLNQNYNGQVIGLSYNKFKIPMSDPAEHTRVAKVKVRFMYNEGDLEDLLVDTTVADDRDYDKCKWGEREFGYILNVNDICIPGKIVEITRTNKTDLEKYFTVTLRTQELESAAQIGHYLNDKENPCVVVLNKES
jgi:hypothetical protein